MSFFKEFNWSATQDGSIPNEITNNTEDGEDITSFIPETPELPNEETETTEAQETETSDKAKTETEETEEATKETSTEETTEDDQDPIEFMVNMFAEKGILHYNEDKEYSEGEDMLEEVIEDTIIKRIEDKRSKIDPKKREVIEHLENGGDLEILRQVENAFDYSLVDLESDENKLINSKALVAEHLQIQGYTEDEIKEELEELEDLGEEKLLKKAKVAQKYFVKQTEEQKAKLIEEDKKRVAERIKQETDEIKELEKNILSKTEIAGIKVSKKDTEALRDFILVKDKKTGLTQAEKIAQDPDVALQMYYFAMKGFNFSDIEKKVETKKTTELKKVFSQFTDKNATAKGGKTVKTDPAPEAVKITLPSWMGNTIGSM